MEITDQASHLAHETVDKITDVSQQISDAICEKGEQLKNAEQHLLKNCCSYVSTNPVTSLGIAVVAGFMLSRIVSSR